MHSFSYSKENIKKILPQRKQNSHKGTYGRVLIIGGASGMAGAPAFAAKAAYRMGAGLVEIFTYEENRVVLQTLVPEAIITCRKKHSDLVQLSAAISKADVIAIGMGLSDLDETMEILKFTLKTAFCPIVIDADALNCIAKNKKLLQKTEAEIIVTPHPLEMSRLTDIHVNEITADITYYAQHFADKHQVICVLKDHNTAVAYPGNESIYINQSGNSGMSTGGSGDVLDGVIAGLLAQGSEPYNAATLGVYIHGLAGEKASEKLSEYSVMASDIIDAIPDVLNSI